MNLSTILKAILAFPQYAGICIFYVGREGSGKTDLAQAVASAYGTPEAVVPFSKILGAYLTTIQSTQPELVRQIRKKMAARNKSIKHSVLCSAMRYGFQQIPENQCTVVNVEGFLRSEQQCRDALQLIGEFFPNHLLVCVEATCASEIALPRALGRKQGNDVQAFLEQCHIEYDAKHAAIFAACSEWAHMLQVSNETTFDQTLVGLEEAFAGLLSKLKLAHKPKTPAYILNWQATGISEFAAA